MKATRFFILAIACMSNVYASAQDLIVKKDGSVIQAKVTKIGTSEVEYKKWSNQDGPQYSIAVTDIFAINYQNGERETFENVCNNGDGRAVKVETNGQQAVVQVKIEDLSPEAKAANDALVAQYNDQVDFNILEKYQDEVGKKKAERGTALLKVANNSILSDDNIEVRCITGSLRKASKNSPARWASHNYCDNPPYFITDNPAILFSIRNKTNQTIYLDLANTFYVTMGQSTCFYIPTSTTNLHSSSGGGSVNLGAVTGALGIGGAVGTLSNGINIGGSSTNTTSSTTYSQRIIAVAPQSMVHLSPQYLFCNEMRKIFNGLWYYYVSSSIASNSYDYCVSVNFPSKSDEGPMMLGDNYRYSYENSPVKMSFFVAYSTSEQCTKENVLYSYFYLSDIFGNYLRKQFANYHLAGELLNHNVLQFGIKVTDDSSESFPR